MAQKTELDKINARIAEIESFLESVDINQIETNTLEKYNKELNTLLIKAKSPRLTGVVSKSSGVPCHNINLSIRNRLV